MRKVMICIVFIVTGTVAAAEVVIAALGDSLTQGYGLPAEQGFVPQMQAWLDAKGADVRLINAGVSGDTTAGGLARVGWTLTPDVDGLIVALGGNDLLRGLDPDQARSNIEGILQAAKEIDVEVLLVGMEAPGNYGSEYKSRFDALYPELAGAYATGYFQNFFAGLIEAEGAFDPATAQKWFQSDGIHPNADGVALIVGRMGPDVLTLLKAAED